MALSISLDYDDTFTLDPKFWISFCCIAKKFKHKVYVVTWRSKEEGQEVIDALEGYVEGIFFTERTAKRQFMLNNGHHIDIWIDDFPESIITSLEDIPESEKY